MRGFRAILCFLTSLLLSFCTSQQKKKKVFLQQETIHIAQPRVHVTNTIIDSFVTITASLRLHHTEIHYTSNGKEPSLSSPKYKFPIQVSKPKLYKFKAFHPDWKPSETSEITFYKKGHSTETIIWHSKENKQYKGQGITTLVNHKKASLDFNDPQWVGFDSIADATIYFKESTFIKSLTIGYLNDPASWIFPPKSITVSFSEKGTHLYKKEIKIYPLQKSTARYKEDVNIDIGQKVKYIRIEVRNLQSIPEWHEGKGKKAWLFMDEWIFNRRAITQKRVSFPDVVASK